MQFNSFPFLFLFLPVVVTVYYLCARHFAKWVAQTVLIAASLVFYSLGNISYTPLLVGSILFNHAAGKAIARASAPSRRHYLAAALVANIALLGSFKYVNFIFGSLAFLWKPGFLLPDWVFPLGLSFFTLQQVMYLVDCYEGLVPANDLLTHAVFMSFFPSLISGPITKTREMAPQILQPATTNTEKVSQGLTLLAIGLFKKVVLADSFAQLADAGFSQVPSLSTLEALVSSFSYTFQIYFDFSGYTDLAIAAALLLGFSIPINFDMPYRSLSVTEFWQRWHITLSQCITTYLYTPIVRGFEKATLAKASFATLVALTIMGLWHGPAWTFVLFGVSHGLALVLNLVWRKKVKIPVPKPLAWVATMLFINGAFIFFRAKDVKSALQMCLALLPHHNLLTMLAFKNVLGMAEIRMIFGPLLIGVAAALLGRDSLSLSKQVKPRVTTAFAVASVILISLLYLNSNVGKEFVYFAF